MSDSPIVKNADGFREGDVEVWYDSVKDETFQTKFVPLEPEDAKAIIAAFYQETDEAQQNRLDRLIGEIDACIQSFPAKAAFVRLSHLSPKDGALTMINKLVSLFKENLNDVQLDRAEEFVELNRAIYQLCKSQTGDEAMTFFTKSNRSVKHFQSQLKQISDETPWKMNIVVREWNEIAPEYEFRAFVYQKRMTAITHYYKFCYVRDVALQKEMYCGLMQDYYNNIADTLPDNCVLDFCILPDTKEVRVVELNPWSVHASSALFDWDKDKAVLTGDAPFEFRISDKPHADLMERISSTLAILWQTVRPLRYEEGEQIPRTEERIVYSFKWSSYKTLPFYKFSSGFVLNPASTIDWDYFLREVIPVHPRDGLERTYWENSSRFFQAIGMNIKSFQNFEKDRSPHWITTLDFIIVVECAVISHKGKRLPDYLNALLPVVLSAYQWIFDVFQHFNQPQAIKDKNSSINVAALNACQILRQWEVLASK